MNPFTPEIIWIWLSYLGKPNREIRVALFEEYHTLNNIWAAAEAGEIPAWMEDKEYLHTRFTDPTLRAKATAIYEKSMKAGMSIITIDHVDYPYLLKQIHTVPSVLYCYGTLPKKMDHMISLVGSRRCTSYGLNNASWFAGHLARHGIGIVSGMARGIDGAAHKGALQVGGYTIAVLACGADVVYPKEHQYFRELHKSYDHCELPDQT